MDAVAAQGIAEHSHYKQSGDGSSAEGSYNRARKWLQGLLEMQQAAGDSMEFIDSVKKELFPDEVYVFTPKGSILELPKGATPVDFAYAVHTDVGNSCISCRVDRHLSALSEPLKTGQTVEIITTPRAQPNMAWLNFVVTGKARTSIRHFLKNQKQHESIELGRRLLNQYLAQYEISVDKLDQNRLDKLLQDLNFETFDALLEDIGLGNRMAYVIAQRLQPTDDDTDEPESLLGTDGKPISIRGAEGMVMHFARCCYPIPGDNIVGNISAGRGLVVHRSDCRNLNGKRDESTNRNIYIEWGETGEDEYTTVIEVQVESQRGIIAQLAMAVSSVGGNVNQLLSGEKDGQMNAVTIELTVTNRVHLARVMKKLRAIKQVTRVSRT
jgi:GTP pyrophosphokinase/guanosine-3',5'-bis(diphosphate) 3'-pyrophosphohydrolase